MSTTPMSGNRNFDPTVLGLHKNQQLLVFILMFPLMACFLISIFVIGPHWGVYVSIGFAIFEILFFMLVGRTNQTLYYFERNLRFMWSIHRGTDYINKYGFNGIPKARSLTHIKKIHDGGIIEFFYTQARPHRWGSILFLKAFKPEDYEVFKVNVERMLIGLPDGTIIKTTLKVRSDLTDHAEPIRRELGKVGLPQIIRESMNEHMHMCELANEKSYENHMLLLLPYTASDEVAKHQLGILTKNIMEILNGMRIYGRKLENESEIVDMFYGDITFNVHGLRRF